MTLELSDGLTLVLLGIALLSLAFLCIAGAIYWRQRRQLDRRAFERVKASRGPLSSPVLLDSLDAMDVRPTTVMDPSWRPAPLGSMQVHPDEAYDEEDQPTVLMSKDDR